MSNPEKINLVVKPKLLVFDMDGTIVQEPLYYKQIYSCTLNQTVEELCGQMGLAELAFCRQNFEGKGELALGRLGIPFREWAKRLIAAPCDLITPQPKVVQRLRQNPIPKVVFTGSPKRAAEKILTRFGFNPEIDFVALYGWSEPELEPLKWYQSRQVFEEILNRFKVSPERAWSVGDNWETDLAPAKELGMITVQIKKETGNPNFRFPTALDLIDFLETLKGGD